ncbi:EamA family transporter [Rhizobium sp. PL01]|uniref:EamA family transporter n=1 Tax=Rhizobium sp. PL01 TaxID=3085631 RepID=UPI002981C27D|nr:EamA family transporter [Rhizobium sp. PL01]MDW5317113.1 permease [Rhizobium sp. PL01]
MNGSLTLPMIGLICFCILAETAREVCFKHAASDSRLGAALIKPVTWAGIIFWAVELASWTAVLQKVPLSIAFPLMALSYATIVMAGAILFKEHINFNHATGVFLITAGVVCVGVTGL